ncbi:glutamyl-tRNA synthetase [Atractiella rhizophila]|nr:glutamyl-tRNA synthetase [Atractiella rhizophila]
MKGMVKLLPFRVSLRRISSSSHSSPETTGTSTILPSAKSVVPMRLRFAPSPTGYLHIGGLRVALFNYLLARKTGGQFILRIDDTDKAREVTGSEERILEGLKWAGLTPDEGAGVGGPYAPYHQSRRLHIYRPFIDKLLAEGSAYPCFCTKERVERINKEGREKGISRTYDRFCASLSREEAEKKIQAAVPHVIRFKCPSDRVGYTDLVYGPSSSSPSTSSSESVTARDEEGSEDFVLIKSDGMPTYHFASTVDDHLMGITHVLRGEEWRPWTGRHIHLINALGMNQPQWAHLPIMVNPDGSKISKRDGQGGADVTRLYKFEPEAVKNWLVIMGWGREKEKGSDVMSIEEMIAEFDISGVNRRRAVKDEKKLVWLNKQHLGRKAQDEVEGLMELVQRSLEGLRTIYGKSSVWDWEEEERERWIGEVVRAVHGNLETLDELPPLVSYFFDCPNYEDATAKEMLHSISLLIHRRCLTIAIEYLMQKQDQAELIYEDASAIHSEIKQCLGEEFKKERKSFAIPLRHALTGRKSGAPLGEVMRLLGKEECLKRLRTVLHSLPSE